MFKNLNKISKLFINNNINNITYLNINNNLKYLNILNYSKKHNDFTRRNSYTHKQDLRATKRRESSRDSEEMGGQVGPGDIVTETNNPTISKPNHKHSKPITHRKKLEQLDHHHQKKINREFKENERLELIETLEKEREIDQLNQFNKLQKEREELEQFENEENNEKQIRSKRQKSKKPSSSKSTKKRNSATFIDSVSGAAVVESEGTTEYSDFKSNEIDSDLTNITFENDLSIGSRYGNKEFDISKIDKSKIIDFDELSFEEVEEEESNDEGGDNSLDYDQDALVLTMEEAREKFNFKDEDFNKIFEQLDLEEHFKFMVEEKAKDHDILEGKELNEQEESKQQKLKQDSINQKHEENEYIKEMFNKKYGSKQVNTNPITINEVVEFMSDSHLDDFCVIDVSNKCSWTKYLVIASSDSARLLQNVQMDLVSHFKNRNKSIQFDPSNTDDWLVVDLKNVVVHLFETKKREHFDLETLWSTRRHINYTGKEESWDDELTSRLEDDQ